LRPASHSDEVYTPSLRRSEGRRDQLGGRCPSRAASKTSLPTLNGQRNSNRSLILTPIICIWFKKNSTIYFTGLFTTSSLNPLSKCHSKANLDNQLVTPCGKECPQIFLSSGDYLLPSPVTLSSLPTFVLPYTVTVPEHLPCPRPRP